MNTKKYPSKISFWFLTLVFLVIFVPLLLFCFGKEIDSKISLLIISSASIYALVAHMLLKTEYLIEENLLKIKCGFFNYKPIKVEEITKIVNSKCIASSPASSFDRIEVKYGKFGGVVLSPKNKVEFSKHLISLNPSIVSFIVEEKTLQGKKRLSL